MNTKTSFAAALAVTTMLTGGLALAATSSMQPSHQEAVLSKDAGMLSSDAACAYHEVADARLAIFDGRIADAKKDAQAADAGFMKAKSDRSVFMKADADFKAPGMTPGATGIAPDKTASKMTANDAAGSKTAKAWLPVNGEVILGEDYTASPQKSAAVADANKSLATNDRKGAAEKLRLADVDVGYVVAVVPLDQTLSDVHKAAGLIADGKYYEASQVLRHVQNSTRFDVADAVATPMQAHAAAKAPTK